ncbi:MAG: carboxy-S-adenosyl-L-methionine synthase CmoA [Planctomycetales bacterium]|nr:carboxy-S-adenosyl-L-methionine synthase CmoA [Planctomycetales bacterium]
MAQDRIYAKPQATVDKFAFDQAVVEVFPDMISRSVPGYASMLAMIDQLAARFIQPNTHIYDLGCSLGAATLLMHRRALTGCHIHAVDSSAAMVVRLREILAKEQSTSTEGCHVHVHEADIRGFPMRSASLIVLNLTLQFIPIEDRLAVLTDCFQALEPEGALLLSEKICIEDPGIQLLLTELHHDFKRAQGYSDLEIAQKRTAIENKLVPETLDRHTERLKQAGFPVVALWFQCFNFVSILAVKR